MIEDIEGATSEPARRGHFLVLSSAVAVVSLALFVVLVMPPSRDGAVPVAASPASSSSIGPVMTIISVPLSQLRVDLTRASACSDGTKLVPPYHLAVDVTSGRVMAVVSDPRTDRSAGRSVPVALEFNAQAGYLTAMCAPNDGSVLWDKVAP